MALEVPSGAHRPSGPACVSRLIVPTCLVSWVRRVVWGGCLANIMALELLTISQATVTFEKQKEWLLRVVDGMPSGHDVEYRA
ncbi:hypothetical protein K440DRAFT_58872 [Wilcoxina mikolae CBS 423.85]|nr:hypothetical protein K440DRAFT_58872 [Wilcoxina mikolae CBS 423.85]